MLEAASRVVYQWSTLYRANRQIVTLEGALRRRDPILLVHQMGRAGSMTVVNSLRTAGFSAPVFHTHWLNPETVRGRLSRLKHLPERRHPLNIRVSYRISQTLAHEGVGSRDWTLVTVFREPVARNISAFFLGLRGYVEDLDRRVALGTLDDSCLLEVFLKDFPHHLPLTWFDREVRDVFGCDVYAAPFPVERGYKVLRSGQVNLLLVKLEKLNSCYREAFTEFLGVSVDRLVNTHRGENDPLRSLYERFTRTVVMPNDYLDRMYSSDFARHLYSAAELDGFRARWSEARG